MHLRGSEIAYDHDQGALAAVRLLGCSRRNGAEQLKLREPCFSVTTCFPRVDGSLVLARMWRGSRKNAHSRETGL